MFKKSILFCCLLLTAAFSTSYAVKAAQPITVVFNGQTLAFDVPPAIINDRTMVPLRVIFEAHGADVHWDNTTGIVTATGSDLTVVASIGDIFINANGNLTAMDVAPVIVDGRTLVPVRFISEALGGEVAWDSSTRTVSITTRADRIPASHIPPTAPATETPTLLDDTLSQFLNFTENFAQSLVTGITSDEDRIRAVYDFMVLNFMYQDGRDGLVVDGSRRPDHNTIPAVMTWSRPVPDIPIFTIESGGFFNWPAHLENSFVPPDLRNQTSILGAYRLLATGEGVCNCFAQLFNLLLASLGYETRYVDGSYINRDGTRLPHAWSAVRLDSAWYFFDTQVEASNLTRLTANRTNIPYHWFRQPVGGNLVAERYVWDTAILFNE